MQRKTIRPTLLNAAIVAALGPVAAAAQDAAAPRVIEIEQIVVTGTRVADRSATETAVPVDVVSGEAISNVGVTKINQALSVMLPSFNFPRPGLADGTDTIRPATLRGLSPDQTLVLMNSKRRHASSLVNVNGTIGPLIGRATGPLGRGCAGCVSTGNDTGNVREAITRRISRST